MCHKIQELVSYQNQRYAGDTYLKTLTEFFAKIRNIISPTSWQNIKYFFLPVAVIKVNLIPPGRPISVFLSVRLILRK